MNDGDIINENVINLMGDGFFVDVKMVIVGCGK